ncbi:uncharacterized protein BROUX77_000432 [Berkeleyomyces rouxiae]|uniref:uncharacterized protein n=1 Tax=Berkeleyomyces rouxiae TaxID=2035830 RepID=UPI003B814739
MQRSTPLAFRASRSLARPLVAAPGPISASLHASRGPSGASFSRPAAPLQCTPAAGPRCRYGSSAATEGTPSTPPAASLSKLLSIIERTEAMFVSRVDIPREAATLAALKACHAAAKAITPLTAEAKKQSGNSLLEVDDKSAASPPRRGLTFAELRKNTARRISQISFSILAAPNVVVTMPLLTEYIKIHSELGLADTVAESLHLYGSKPLPVIRGDNVTFKKRSSSLPSAAIDEDVAAAALQVALQAKDLDAAINIVDVCYCSRAFYLRKIMASATVPALAAGVIPATSYGVASAFANYNSSIDPTTATTFAFMGITAYIGFTGSMGIVARMSMMDHMNRVTWVPGTPMRKRWLREEERAAMDKIAMAWGFQEAWKHGEESGAEWASLREYLGLKDMILDRVEFMDGMN